MTQNFLANSLQSIFLAVGHQLKGVKLKTQVESLVPLFLALPLPGLKSGHQQGYFMRPNILCLSSQIRGCFNDKTAGGHVFAIALPFRHCHNNNGVLPAESSLPFL